MKQYDSLNLLLESVKQFNLKSAYDGLNKTIFGNKLEPVDLLWSDRNDFRGNTAVIGDENDPDSWYVKHVEISKNNAKTPEEVMGILAHEMIHVHRVQNQIPQSQFDHDGQFDKKVNKINRMNLGFQIPFVESVCKI